MIKQIPVTAEHIQRGKRVSAFECPVALALNGAGCRAAAVVHENSSVTIDGHPILLDHDEELAEWIHAFDVDEPVGPIALELRILDGEEYGVLEVVSA